MTANNDVYEEGWFYGYSPELVLANVLEDGATRYVERDTKNVIGRFCDIDYIDVIASKAAKRACYKKVTVLETRILSGADGRGADTAITRMRFFRPYTDESLECIKRFRSAWNHYQSHRQTPVLEDEYIALNEAGIPTKKPQITKDEKKTTANGRGGRRPGAGRPRKTAKK